MPFYYNLCYAIHDHISIKYKIFLPSDVCLAFVLALPIHDVTGLHTKQTRKKYVQWCVTVVEQRGSTFDMYSFVTLLTTVTLVEV